MAAIYDKFKCPKCFHGTLLKIDRMVRCTCGWWTQINEEEDVPINSIEYAIIVAS
ncbi:MAG: hypothetical protein JXA54_09155 [Candidatus Heimdallarchaeota archaeon]|nr:hypothetical protein [Candidatus Heimdallarchaeota archaeon]